MKHGKPFEVKQVSEAGSISGYGSVFNNVDLGYDVMQEGAFANSLKDRERVVDPNA